MKTKLVLLTALTLSSYCCEAQAQSPCQTFEVTVINSLTNDDDKVYDSLFFYDHLTEYDWYPLFLDGNHPLTVIENQTAPADAPTLMLVKDSFGNTLAPLLVPSYKKIVLVDPRYYRGSVSDLCREHGADELLFCYSLERICTDLNLSILK